uniref:Putative LOC100197594 [Hydra vulgaris] n=1 Tax=Lepeophtheirus salmonis TaxID=72036 RepID=A0A0K2TDE1_LEPSM
MVVVGRGKKMTPSFFKPGEKIGQDAYYKVLRFNILPWLKSTYPEDNYARTQDGAPSHTHRPNTRSYVPTNMTDVWTKDMWLSSSPDLKLLDFAMWGTLERETNRTSHSNVDSLKAVIVNV